MGTYIDELKRKAHELEEELNKTNLEKDDLQNILSNILCSILITSKETRKIVYANPFAQSQFEISEDELIGLPVDTFYANSSQKDKVINNFRTKGLVRNLEIECKTYDDKKFPALLSLMDIIFRGEECYVGIISDISLQKKQIHDLQEINERVIDTTLYDEMTGLNNKKSFFDKGGLLFDVHRIEELPLSLLVINIDKLNDINEFFGREVGDIIIKLFSEKIKTLVRKHDLICRYNTNDFVIMLPNVKSKVAHTMAENFIDKISTLTYLTDSGEKLRVYISIGIAYLKTESKKEQNIDLLYKEAKEAVTLAKSKGKARIKLA